MLGLLAPVAPSVELSRCAQWKAQPGPMEAWAVVPGAAGMWRSRAAAGSRALLGQETHMRLTGPSAGCSECVLFLFAEPWVLMDVAGPDPGSLPLQRTKSSRGSRTMTS